MWVADELLAAAVRAGGVQTTRVVARRGGAPVWTTDLPVLPGSAVRDNPASGGVRRTLTLNLRRDRGLEGALAPTGTTLHPYTVVTLTDGRRLEVPHGVFDVDTARAGVGPGDTLTVTAPDLWARVQRAQFVTPNGSLRSATVARQIDALLGAAGIGGLITTSRRAQAIVRPVVWERDRAKAIEELAAGVGAYVSFDRLGRPVLADLPDPAAAAVWDVDAGLAGVLMGATRETSRRGVANVVVVTAEKADAYGPPFSPVIVWDNNPASPTYAGPDPVGRPDLAGPFGVVVDHHSSPTIPDTLAATAVGRARLARLTTLGSQLTMTAVRHPGLDAYDLVNVTLPRAAPADRPLVERHVVEAVTHPLDPDGAQQITGRNTRTDL